MSTEDEVVPEDQSTEEKSTEAVVVPEEPTEEKSTEDEGDPETPLLLSVFHYNVPIDPLSQYWQEMHNKCSNILIGTSTLVS